jgi:hypothetical protein
LTYDGLLKHYSDFYKKSFFPKIHFDETIRAADKAYIKNILTKPFALYNLRHSALTTKNKISKEHLLRNHASWSINSKMPQTYIHYFGNDSSDSLIEAKGIVKENRNTKEKDILKPKYCIHCNEINTQISKWCIKCRMVLSYDAYTETLEKQKKKDNDIEELKRSVSFLSDRFNAFLQIQPGKTIIYDINDQIKGIAKSELSHKGVGQVKINPSSLSNNNKKKIDILVSIVISGLQSINGAIGD